MNLDWEFAEILGEVFDAAAAEGIGISITSGWRSPERQQQLYRRLGPKRVARPGQSYHEFGFAVDIQTSPPGALKRVGEIAESFGLRWGGRFKAMKEPWHIDAGNLLSISRAKQVYARGGRLVSIA